MSSHSSPLSPLPAAAASETAVRSSFSQGEPTVSTVNSLLTPLSTAKISSSNNQNLQVQSVVSRPQVVLKHGVIAAVDNYANASNHTETFVEPSISVDGMRCIPFDPGGIVR